MRCLRTTRGVSGVYQLRNERVRVKSGNKKSMVLKVKKGVLQWFRHKMMSEERLIKMVYVSEVERKRKRGRVNWR